MVINHPLPYFASASASRTQLVIAAGIVTGIIASGVISGIVSAGVIAVIHITAAVIIARISAVGTRVDVGFSAAGIRSRIIGRFRCGRFGRCGWFDRCFRRGYNDFCRSRCRDTGWA